MTCLVVMFAVGERRQNAIHEFRTYHKTRPVLYTGRHKRSTTLTLVSGQSIMDM